MFGPPAAAPFDPGVLCLARDLRAAGIEPTRRAWHQVRRGVWVPSVTWRGLSPEQRHAALVHGTALGLAREEAVFALTSAAAVWGLPRIEPWPDGVHVLSTHDERGRVSSVVKPHVGRPADTVLVHGVRVTSVARTVADLARTGSLASAVAAGDHAVRHGLCTRAELEAEVGAIPPRVRGRVRAGIAADLVDPLAMSPGESLSRVQMFLLDLPRPVLQQEVRDDEGLVGYADFGWRGVLGEFDGRVKYGVSPGTDPTDASAVLWAEKLREDRMRRHHAVARWTWAVARDRDALGRLLWRHGIRPQAVNTWFDVGHRRSS